MYYVLNYSTTIDEKTIIKLCEYSSLNSFNGIYNYVLDKVNKININHFKQFYDSDEYNKKYLNYYNKFNFLKSIQNI